MTFISDLKFEQKINAAIQKHKMAQKLLKTLIPNNITHTYFIPGNFKPFDQLLFTTSNYYKVEYKIDRMCTKTGNVFVEYKCNNKPSGITSTQANYYVYIVYSKNKPNTIQWLVLDVRDLVSYISNNNLKTVKGGDGFRAEGYLIKEEDLTKQALVVKSMTIKTFNKFVGE